MINDFFAEQDLTFDHVKSLAAGMYDVARVDGVHDREMAMIRDFYEGCSRAGDPPLEDVVGKDFDFDGAKALFGTKELSMLFVKSLILLAFAARASRGGSRADRRRPVREARRRLDPKVRGVVRAR